MNLQMNHQATIEQAWKNHQKNLISFIRSKVDTVEDAEDILNDVFTALINKASNKNISGNVPDNITSWLYHVTKNKIVDYYRSKKRFEELPKDLISRNEDTDAMHQLSNCILPMIKALPKNYQRPLILSEIEGKKYRELASELNLSLPAVKSRIIRGRKKLYKSILACCTIQRDVAGNTMNYEQKGADFCDDCAN